MDTLIKTILDKVAKLPAKRNLMYDVEGFTDEEMATIQERLAAQNLHVELTGTKRHPVLEIHPQV